MIEQDAVVVARRQRNEMLLQESQEHPRIAARNNRRQWQRLSSQAFSKWILGRVEKRTKEGLLRINQV